MSDQTYLSIPVPEGLNHYTAELMQGFFSELLEKARKAEIKYGYSNTWRDPSWQQEWQRNFLEHVEKGDPRDVAIFCAFAFHHGWKTFDSEMGVHVTVVRDWAAPDPWKEGRKRDQNER